MKPFIALLSLAFTTFTFGQVNNDSALSIDEIMQGDDFVGYLPTRVSWADNSKSIYFSWNPDNDTIPSTYQVDIKSRKISKSSFEALKQKSNLGEYSKNGQWMVYQKDGDLFLMNTNNYSKKQITNTIDRESNPVFSGDEKSIIYKRDSNLFQWHVSNGTVTQLTNFKTGSEKEEPKLSVKEQWLEDDQLQYFNILEKRKNETDARTYRNEQLVSNHPKPIFLEDKNLVDFDISADLNFVIYSLSIPQKHKNTNVPSYVTESGYTENLSARPKVGVTPNSYESWILNIKTGETYQIKTNELSGIKDKPKYLKEYAENSSEYKDTFDDPRGVEIGRPVFSGNGKALVNITSQDNKDRWIILVNLEDGSLKQIDKQHDDAWIGGPGVGWFSRAEMGG
ncbi:dipeptidyl peptidase IV [Algibacter lectus]|uniref:Dipeptidyl peptidase IV n=1 Tax=Algibacter lectus TaxID=221126 RepID=A0A090WSN0_9FLAO|nr:hypothetical protein [Algibacter lectus]GAL78384.1 dipeptidyl peptidase IV [Algibacter lectus]